MDLVHMQSAVVDLEVISAIAESEILSSIRGQ